MPDWCNNENFPSQNGGKKGIDPLIGQLDPLPPRDETSKKCEILGMKDPTALREPLDRMPYVNELILPAGGEYFFAPSITALKTTLAKKA
jgi:hypothetical protein